MIDVSKNQPLKRPTPEQAEEMINDERDRQIRRDYEEATKDRVNHECSDRPSSYSDIQIQYDPEDREWDLVVDYQWCSTIKYCPYCGCQLTEMRKDDFNEQSTD